MKKQYSLLSTAAVLLVGLGVTGGVSYTVLQHPKPVRQKGTQPVAVTATTDSTVRSSQDLHTNPINSSADNSTQESSKPSHHNQDQNQSTKTPANSVANSAGVQVSNTVTSKASETTSTSKGTSNDTHRTTTAQSANSLHTTQRSSNSAGSTKGNTTGSGADSTDNSTSTRPASSPPTTKVVVPGNAASVAEVEQAVASALHTSVSTIDLHSTQKYVTLQESDEMVWKWLKMSKVDAQYEPGGGSALSWGNIEGVNTGISDSILLHKDVTALKDNLSYLMNKNREVSPGVYQLCYAPGNDHAAYFQGSNDSPSLVASAVEARNKWYSGITVSVKNGDVLISIPTYSMNKPWDVSVQEMNAGATYSLDNGKTWIASQWGYASAAKTEGGLVNPPDRVLFKIQKPAGGVWLMFTDSALKVPEFGRMMVQYDAKSGLVVS